MGKKAKPEGKKYSYMDTYGDLVTLLLCFFVLLFSMSTVEESKFNAFAEALAAQFGQAAPSQTAPAGGTGQGGTQAGNQEPTGEAVLNPDQTLPQDFAQLQNAISKYIEENNMQGEVQVEKGASGATFIRLTDSLLFGGNSSVLRPEAKEFLDFLGASFLSVEDQIFRVRFLGHTASIAGSAQDDWILSQERSGRVASYFERTVGFSPFRMEAVGYGRHFPIGDNSTAEGLARNRRVDIVVISNDATSLGMALAEAARVYFPGDDIQYFEGPPEELPQTTLDSIAPLNGIDLSKLTPEQLQSIKDAVDSVDSSV